MRIAIPEGVNPVVYLMNEVGSPRLRASKLESWEAQYVNDSTLTAREREAMRTRFTYIIGCASCRAWRPAASRPGFSSEPIEEEFYEHVAEYATWPKYTRRERLLIRFVERFAHDYLDLCNDDGFWRDLRESFTDTELADICILAGVWDSSTKMYHLLGGVGDSCAVAARTL
jgi:alkylhydroperoxidase family enzyme